MIDAWDPIADDEFGEESLVGDVVTNEYPEVDEWLAGTSWRAAFDLPLEPPLHTDYAGEPAPEP